MQRLPGVASGHRLALQERVRGFHADLGESVLYYTILYYTIHTYIHTCEFRGPHACAGPLRSSRRGVLVRHRLGSSRNNKEHKLTKMVTSNKDNKQKGRVHREVHPPRPAPGQRRAPGGGRAQGTSERVRDERIYKHYTIIQ